MLGALLWLYRRQGWTTLGKAPEGGRAVILGVPHTSNWDFLFFLGVTHDLGIRPRFMGKNSLFRWPMTRFMREMGGVPVVRSASHNYVEQMIEQFAQHEDFMLVVAPEGTRGGVSRWRSGFYHIALGAGVPIVCGYVDYPARRGGLGPAIMPTGDFRADMAKIAAFYRENGRGKHPEKTQTDFDAMLREGE